MFYLLLILSYSLCISCVSVPSSCATVTVSTVVTLVTYFFSSFYSSTSKSVSFIAMGIVKPYNDFQFWVVFYTTFSISFCNMLNVLYFGANFCAYFFITFVNVTLSNSSITWEILVSLICLSIWRLYYHFFSTLSYRYFCNVLAISNGVYLNVSIMTYIDSSTWFISNFPSLPNSICVRPDKSTVFLIFSHINCLNLRMKSDLAFGWCHQIQSSLHQIHLKKYSFSSVSSQTLLH